MGGEIAQETVVQKIVEDIHLTVQPGGTEATAFIAISSNQQRDAPEFPLGH